MHTIISIALLMAMAQTQTFDSCTEYCNLLKYDHLRLYWRPDCECSLEYQGSNNRNNKQTKFNQQLTLDNTAIYYEPSDEYSYDKTSFVKQPFYILNPTFRRQSFKNTENRKARKIHTDKHAGELDRPLGNQDRSNNAERSFGIEKVDLPLYLDIDVYKSIKNGKSNDTKANNLKKTELTEDDLIECLDLHILVYARKIDQDANMEDMWDETKINKYRDLSDSDLMIEIQSKCHQPTKIVHESLEEIKSSWPRKSQLRSSQDIKTNKIFENDNMDDKFMEIITTGQNSQSNSSSTTERVIDRNVVNMLTKEPIEKISILPTTTEYTNYNSNFDTRTILSEVNWSTDFTTANNFAVKNVTETTPEIIDSNYNESRTDNVFKKEINFGSKINLQNDSLYQFSNQIFTEDLEATTKVDPYTNFLELGETKSQKFLTKSDINSLFNQSVETDTRLADTNTFSSPNARDQQNKEMIEADMRIPRIFTKEFENDTVVSSVSGVESIPNNDFVKKPMMSHYPINDYVENISTAKNTTEETYSLNDLLETTTNDPLNIIRQYKNKNQATNSSKDFTTVIQIHFHGKEPNSDNLLPPETQTLEGKRKDFINPEFSNKDLFNNFLANETDSNISVDNEFSLQKEFTTNTYENKEQVAKSSERSNEVQIIINNTYYPVSTNVTPEFDSFIANETQIGEEVYFRNRNVPSDLELYKDKSLDFSPLNYSDKIKMQTRKSDESSLTSQKSLTYYGKNIKQNIENSKGSTSGLHLFSYGSQNAEYSTNYEAREVPELLTKNIINNIAISTKEERNYTLRKSFPQPSATIDYSYTTEEMEKNSQYFTSQGVTSESPSYTSTSIPTTSQSDEDDTTPPSQNVSPYISDSFDDLISSENNVELRLFSPTTDDPYKTFMKTTVKENEFGSPNRDELVGKLYFLFDGNQVPVRFVQNSNGQIRLGLDGKTLCDKIVQKDTNVSILMKALCNCARSKNCMNV